MKRLLSILCAFFLIFTFFFSYAEEIPTEEIPSIPIEEITEVEIEDEVTIEETPLEEEAEIENDLSADRHVSLHFSWAGEVLHWGDRITLIADLQGFEGLNYELTWQYSTDNANWHDWSSNSFILDKENYYWYWRLSVTYWQ